MKDALGDRMKEQYENRTRYLLPRRTYTIIRCDGKAFHTLTKYCKKPFDPHLMEAMVEATRSLCVEAQGACFGYTQSDEISVLLQDFADVNTDAWFNGNVQKIASVAASCVTKAFNSFDRFPLAMFDARVFTIPDPYEVENYFIWRQQDASRNSLQMLARMHYSHKELVGKNNAAIHEMLHEKGVNWDKLTTGEKRGYGMVQHVITGWHVDDEIPVWTQDREWLRVRIPRIS